VRTTAYQVGESVYVNNNNKKKSTYDNLSSWTDFCIIPFYEPTG